MEDDAPIEIATTTDPRIGAVVQDRYKILKKLGEGGMGAVYLGEHMMIKRKVAIKCLHGQFATDAGIVARFHREALAATAIGHEHIVEVTDMGHFDDGALFMVLEFLQGEDFSHLIEKQGPQPLGRVVRILCQMCDALTAVHARDIVHRDLKPENVFLIKRGDNPDFVKILDFGISKFKTSLDGKEANMTATGAAMGTPYYMSPEQLEGSKGIDHRTDIYALGGIMFHALTGAVPFDAESFPMLMIKICTEAPPSIRSLRPDLPREIDGIISKMLAKSKEARFSDCGELKRALLPFRDLDTPAPEPRSAQVRPMDGDLGRTEEAVSMADTDVASAEMVAKPGRSAAALPKVITQAREAQRAQERQVQEQQAQEQQAQERQAEKQREQKPAEWGTGATAATYEQTGPPVEVPVKSLRTPIFGGAVIAAALVGAFIFYNFRGGGETEEQAMEEGEASGAAVEGAGPTVPQPATTTGAVSGVHVKISTEPPEARLFLDDSRIANPFDGELPSSKVPRRLEARLDGYETVSQQLVLQFPQTVRLKLEPETPSEAESESTAVKSRASGKRRRRPSAGATGNGAATAPAAPAASTAATPATASSGPPPARSGSSSVSTAAEPSSTASQPRKPSTSGTTSSPSKRGLKKLF